MGTGRDHSVLRWIIGLLLLGVLLVLTQVTVGWDVLLRPWRSLATGTVSIALVMVLLSFVVRTFRIQAYFRPEVGRRFFKTFRLMLLHNVMNNLLPMRTGEASFPILMGKEFGVPMVRSVPGLLYLRLLDLHFVLVLGASVLGFQKHPGLGAAAIALAPLPFLFLPIRRRLSFDPDPGSGWVGRTVSAALAGLPDSGGLFFRVWVWSAANWTIKLGAYGWILTAFIPIPLGQAILGSTTGELSSVLPVHGVAGAGTYEAGVIAGLVPLGVDLNVALTGAVNLHLFVLGASILAGAVAMAVPGRGRKTMEDSTVQTAGGTATTGGAPAVEAPAGEAPAGENTQQADIFDK